MVTRIHIHCLTSEITGLVLQEVEVVGVNPQNEKMWTPCDKIKIIFNF